jgi:hypothetical protein
VHDPERWLEVRGVKELEADPVHVLAREVDRIQLKTHVRRVGVAKIHDAVELGADGRARAR